MDDINDTFDDIAGLEKMGKARFDVAYTVRRPAQAGLKYDEWDKIQLPTGSILHSLNGFETLVSPNHGLPDATLPVILNEKFPIYLKINTQLASEDSIPFGVRENYIYRPNVLTAQMAHFYQTHRRYHRVLSDRTLGTMAGALVWVDYSPLNEVKVNGTLHLIYSLERY